MISRYMPFCVRVIILALVYSTVAFSSSVTDASLFPDTGKTAILLRARDAAGGVRVLVVSLRPGDEDVETLAYVRLSGRAHIISAYVTNGESGEPDRTGMLPQDLAASRRNETAAVLGRLEVDVHYIGLPDPGSIADTASLGPIWNRDSLSRKLDAILSTVKPHVVILSPDRDGGGTSPLRDYIQVLLRDRLESSRRRPQGGWRVDRFWIGERKGKGLSVPAGTRDPVLNKTYREIAAELERGFVTQGVQRKTRGGQVAYAWESALRGKRPSSLVGALDLRIPAPLRALHATIRSFAADIQRGRLGRVALQERMASVMGRIDDQIGSPYDRAGVDMKVLVDWKGNLENLRNALLGVTAEYSISEEILTERQLTYVHIQNVTGLSDSGNTEVYFPATDRGWILNESLAAKLPLRLPGEYRLVTPERVVYDLPWGANDLQQTVPVQPMMLFLIHRGKNRAQNFVYRIPLPFRYAPRFTVEVLTPIVRSIPGEYIVTRLTNHSRDGVRDTISVRDSRVVSNRVQFRLNGKGLSATDTLHLRWLDTLAGGTQLIPVSISDVKVAEFAARQFPVALDSSRRVVLLSGTDGSPTADALRRLGLPQVRIARSLSDLKASIDACDVLVMDRRVTSLWPAPAELPPLVNELARQGKHVIILAQDDVSWNAHPLWERIRLSRNPTLAADIAVDRDSLHAFSRRPNLLSGNDFREWVFATGYNTVRVQGAAGVEIPLHAGKDLPLIVTEQISAGRITYVDLALGMQWMGIHPGSFRILANLLSL